MVNITQTSVVITGSDRDNIGPIVDRVRLLRPDVAIWCADDGFGLVFDQPLTSTEEHSIQSTSN